MKARTSTKAPASARRRRYTKGRRAEIEAATRERIVRAAAELHPRHGTLGASYAMIAARAGVSPQSVYNHFPTVGDLVGGCTGHVMAQAPPVDARCFGQATSVPARLRRLATAAYAQQGFLAPWMRLGWGDAERIPELREIFQGGQAQLRELLREAAGASANAAFLDAALVLLDYPAWKSLVAGRTAEQAAALAGDCLVALHQSLCSPRLKESP